MVLNKSKYSSLCMAVLALVSGAQQLVVAQQNGGIDFNSGGTREALIIPPKRVSADQLSGKMVDSKQMAYELIYTREANAPRPGELAPDFELVTADGDRTVKLSDLIKTKPVVLVMSSWGCDVFRESLAGLQQLYSRYSDDAHFVMVYIREVHAKGGFASGLGRVPDAKNIEERKLHAQRCRKQLRLPFLYLVDEMTDPVATRWSAWPVRAFIVEKDNTVIYAGSQGPWGYRPYQGFLHGDGAPMKFDIEFNSQSMEELLEERFPKNVSEPRN